MIIPHEHTNKTLVKNIATKGGASKNVTATFAVASEAEQAAKSPIAGPVDKNFIENALYDQDSRYPGAGGRVHTWAGFSASPLQADGVTPSTTYPIVLTTTMSTQRFRVNGMPGTAYDEFNGGYSPTRKDFIFRAILQNTGYPGTSYSLTLDINYTTSDTTSGPFNREVDITPAMISALNIGTTATFQNVVFYLLNTDGTPLPGGGASLFVFSIDFTDKDGTVKPVEYYNVFGGAKLSPYTYFGTNILQLSAVDDSQYGHRNVRASSNGLGSWWAGNRMPQHWKHYNSLYVGDDSNNYDTYHGKKFFRIRKNRNTYEDIGSLHSPLSSLPNTENNGYDLGPLQGRAIELFGSGGRVTNRNDDFDKSYPDIPNFALTTNSSPSASDYGSYVSSNSHFWVKHSVCQSVKIPDGAVSAKYGAYVQCPNIDNIPLSPAPPGVSWSGTYTSFNSNCFGAIQLSQDYGRGQGAVPDAETNSRVVRGDTIRFANEYTTYSDNFTIRIPPETVDYSGSGYTSIAQYNWNGLATVYSAAATAEQIEANNNNTFNVHPHGFRYPTAVHTTGVTYNDYDYEEFKLVERTWKRADQTGYSGSGWHQASDLDNTDEHYNTYLKQIPYLQLELIFYETVRLLEVIGPITGANYIQTGRIRFFSPFVQFFDANDDIISPS